MTRLTREQRDELRRKYGAASKGEWHVVDSVWLPEDGMTYVIAGHHDPHQGSFVCDVGEIDEYDEEGPDTYEAQAARKEADADFIAAARNALPALLDAADELDRMAEELERYRRAEHDEQLSQRHDDLNGICSTCGADLSKAVTP